MIITKGKGEEAFTDPLTLKTNLYQIFKSDKDNAARE